MQRKKDLFWLWVTGLWAGHCCWRVMATLSFIWGTDTLNTEGVVLPSSFLSWRSTGKYKNIAELDETFLYAANALCCCWLWHSRGWSSAAIVLPMLTVHPLLWYLLCLLSVLFHSPSPYDASMTSSNPTLTDPWGILVLEVFLTMMISTGSITHPYCVRGIFSVFPDSLLVFSWLSAVLS